jgi:hypothetical protein
MTQGRQALLVIRFALELCALAALAYWGFTLDANRPVLIVAGLIAPLLFAVAWGLLVSPKARIRMAASARLAIEVVLWAIAVIALVAGKPALAALFAAVVVANKSLLLWAERRRSEKASSERASG